MIDSHQNVEQTESGLILVCKIVLSQVSAYLNHTDIFSSTQSAYRPGHSTETASVKKIMNDLLLSLDNGEVSQCSDTSRSVGCV